jgi:hypothetical protein
MEPKVEHSQIDSGDWRLIRLPSRRAGALSLAVLACLAAATFLGPAQTLGLVLAGILAVVVGAFLVALAIHHVRMVLLPYDLALSARDTRRTRREWREQATSMAGSGPTGVVAPNADVALRWGMFSLVFPVVGFVGIWYGRDALRFIRMSGGAMGGARRARAGIAFGVIGTIELIALVAYVATYRAG